MATQVSNPVMGNEGILLGDALPSEERLCTVCNEPIPSKRLQAKPDATMCVRCLERKGDVPVLRRYDEACGEDVVSTFFTDNKYIKHNIRRLNLLDKAQWNEEPAPIRSHAPIIRVAEERYAGELKEI